MFTGLIQDLGTVRRLEKQDAAGRLTVATALPMDDLEMGESIAVNGVCLTVVGFGGGQFSADVSPESLARTNLGALTAGRRVNLERALRLCDRLGGHLVSGHVDGVGILVERRKDENAIRFAIEVAPELVRYLVEKGSVAVDGISLTVNAVGENRLHLAVIPHTLEKTTLQERRVGDRVNIETDLLGKYVERLLQPAGGTASAGGLSVDFLAKHGFL